MYKIWLIYYISLLYSYINKLEITFLKINNMTSQRTDFMKNIPIKRNRADVPPLWCPKGINFNKTQFTVNRTLNNNNLTWIGKDMFSNMFRLRTLRLSDNLLHCDCQLSWLARYLRHFPKLAQYTKCHSPNHLKGQNIVELQDQEFKCSGKTWPLYMQPTLLPTCCFIIL